MAATGGCRLARTAGLSALCGGEALPRDLADTLLERMEEFWNLYGPTETTIWSTIERVEHGDGPVSIGRPIANTQVYILGPAGDPVAIGLPGEIWIGGAGVATGYHHRPELTAKHFVPDRFSLQPGERLYRTGDLGSWGGDGRLYHLGRMDHQVKIRGFRIEIGEIEVVLRTHPAVDQAVVIAIEAGAGTGNLKLVAYIVYQVGEDLTATEARRYLRRQLPDVMVPSVIVAVDAIPMTPNGKVDRNALPDPFKNATTPPLANNHRRLVQRRRSLEIWQRILKVDRVGAEDNFFELGGHSLLALKVAAAVEKEIGWRMDPRALFFQNLRQIAVTMRRDGLPIKSESHDPLLFRHKPAAPVRHLRSGKGERQRKPSRGRPLPSVGCGVPACPSVATPTRGETVFGRVPYTAI